MYKEKKNVEKCKKIIKRKDLKKDQNQNKNPSYDNKCPWSDHPKTRFWAYLSSSCINLNLAYITYFESPFGSNVGT